MSAPSPAENGEQAACLCGHPAAAHRRPYRLIAWWWRFELVFGPRPCRYVYWSKPSHDRCACPAYRPALPRTCQPGQYGGGHDWKHVQGTDGVSRCARCKWEISK